MHFVVIGYNFPDIGQACKPHFNLSNLPADFIFFYHCSVSVFLSSDDCCLEFIQPSINYGGQQLSLGYVCMAYILHPFTDNFSVPLHSVPYTYACF